MFHRYSAWAKVADAVIEARKFVPESVGALVDDKAERAMHGDR